MKQLPPFSSLSVVVPAYNEERRLSPTLDRLLAYLPDMVRDFEVIVVDDGSRDRTFEIISDRSAGDPRIKCVRHGQNRGKGAAVKSGVALASKRWVLLVDADLGVPIEEFELIWPHVERAPIVIGSKRVPGMDADQPAWRKFLGGIGQSLIRNFCVDGFYDTQCGFKLIRGDIARGLFRYGRLDGFGYDFEFLWLAQRANIDVAEVPVNVRDDFEGTVSLKSYVRVLAELANFQWGKLTGAYDDAPLRAPSGG